MAINPGLPVSRLVNVTVTLTPNPPQPPDIDTMLILGSSAVIDPVTRMREYADIGGVASDFGTNAPEYFAAALWFEQNPQPTTLFIGRWVQTPSHGQLYGGPQPALNVSQFNTITNGGIGFVIDSVAHNLTSLNFATASNLNGVASIVQAALPLGVTVVWDASFSRFVVTSGTTGTTSTVLFAQFGAGTDLSTLMGLASTSSGAYVANGVVAETYLAAVALFDTTFASIWYGLETTSAVDADVLAVAAYIEAAGNHHYYTATTQEGGALISTDTSNLAYQLKQLHYNRTGAQYSSFNPYAGVSLLARILTTDWLAANTTITLMYKQEPGIIAESLTISEIDALNAINCNVFVNYANDTAIIERGQSASGQFIDTIVGTDWLADAIQSAVFGLLFGTPTKIPQTDAGNHLIATTIENVLIQGVNNGLLAPGQWNSQGFGALKQGDFLKTGYYVFAPPIATQAESTRAARKSVPFQVAAKLAGAIHTVDVQVLVNA